MYSMGATSIMYFITEQIFRSKNFKQFSRDGILMFVQIKQTHIDTGVSMGFSSFFKYFHDMSVWTGNVFVSNARSHRDTAAIMGL